MKVSIINLTFKESNTDNTHVIRTDNTNRNDDVPVFGFDAMPKIYLKSSTMKSNIVSTNKDKTVRNNVNERHVIEYFLGSVLSKDIKNFTKTNITVP